MNKNPDGTVFNRALFSKIKHAARQFQGKMCNLLNVLTQS